MRGRKPKLQGDYEVAIDIARSVAASYVEKMFQHFPDAKATADAISYFNSDEFKRFFSCSPSEAVKIINDNKKLPVIERVKLFPTTPETVALRVVRKPEKMSKMVDVDGGAFMDAFRRSGMTMLKVAEESGVSKAMLQAWTMGGNFRTHYFRLMDVAEALGVNAETLLYDPSPEKDALKLLVKINREITAFLESLGKK